MGRFGKGELLPALDAAVSGLAPGAVSEVVVLEQGVFVLRVVDFAAATRDLEEVREQLMEQLFESRMVEEQGRWVEQARARASIRLLLP
jgi:parvulin-like peptidyl-prolyl isomerase